NGYSNEFPVERYLRNSKAAVIYEGTSQLHTLIQADYALGYREDRPLRCEPLPAEGFERLPAGVAATTARAESAVAAEPASPRPFGRRETATLAALAATFVPGSDAARAASIAAEALVRAVDPAQLGQLRLVLRLLEAPLANLLTTRRGAGFGAMAPDDRE